MKKKLYEMPSAEYVDLKKVCVLLESGGKYDEGGDNPGGVDGGDDPF